MSTPTVTPMSTAADAQAPTGPSPRRQVRDTLLAAVPPFALFSLLHAVGVPYLAAVLAGAALPAARLLVDRLRGRRLDATSAVVGVFLLAGLATALISGDPAAVIASNSVLWLVAGLLFAGSRLAGRPLMRPISRYFLTRTDPAVGPRFDERYRADTGLRRTFGRVSTTWALVLAPVGVVGTVLAFTLPLDVAGVTQLFGPLACVALGIWSTRTLRRAA